MQLKCVLVVAEAGLQCKTGANMPKPSQFTMGKGTMLKCIINTSNTTGDHRFNAAKASGWLQSTVTKTDILCVVVECNERHTFHRRVWYRAFSLRYVCIQCSGTILIP